MNKRIRIFHNRQLAGLLGVNLARWKRWSLAFLPPDPLSGQQSGHARQYYAQDAFKVYLGGHLVGILGFTVQESRQILVDLEPYLLENRFGFDARAVPLRQDCEHPQRPHRVGIARAGVMTFRYTVAQILSESSVPGDGADVYCRRCRITVFHSPTAPEGTRDGPCPPSSCRELDLSGVYWQFSRLMPLTG